MKILICAAGRITDELLKRIGENWQITLIDKTADKLAPFSNRFPSVVRLLAEDASSPVVLENAGLSEQDCVLALTNEDPVKLAIVRFAKEADVKNVLSMEWLIFTAKLLGVAILVKVLPSLLFVFGGLSFFRSFHSCMGSIQRFPPEVFSREEGSRCRRNSRIAPKRPWARPGPAMRCCGRGFLGAQGYFFLLTTGNTPLHRTA